MENSGSSGGQQIRLFLEVTGTALVIVIPGPTANTWSHVTLPLSQLGGLSQITSVDWPDNTGGSLPTFYLVDIALLNAGLPTPTTPAPSAGPSLAVNASAGQHLISPDSYGLNQIRPA